MSSVRSIDICRLDRFAGCGFLSSCSRLSSRRRPCVPLLSADDFSSSAPVITSTCRQVLTTTPSACVRRSHRDVSETVRVDLPSDHYTAVGCCSPVADSRRCFRCHDGRASSPYRCRRPSSHSTSSKSVVSSPGSLPRRSRNSAADAFDTVTLSK